MNLNSKTVVRVARALVFLMCPIQLSYTVCSGAVIVKTFTWERHFSFRDVLCYFNLSNQRCTMSNLHMFGNCRLHIYFHKLGTAFRKSNIGQWFSVCGVGRRLKSLSMKLLDQLVALIVDNSFFRPTIVQHFKQFFFFK